MDSCVRVIDCTCGNWEEIPADEQRWHSQSFDLVRLDGDEAIYKCGCGAEVRSKLRKG